MNVAFKRPRAAHRISRVPNHNNTPGATPSPLSPFAQPPPETISPKSPAPYTHSASQRRHAERDRIGSLTHTPLTASPTDFRHDGDFRTSFSPLEDLHAEAALDVVGQYDGDGDAKGRRMMTVDEMPARAVPPLKQRSGTMPDDVDVDVDGGAKTVSLSPPPLVRAPSEDDDAGEGEVNDELPELPSKELQPPMSPSHSKLRPLRLVSALPLAKRRPPSRT